MRVQFPAVISLLRYVSPQSHRLWFVRQIVNNPRGCRDAYLHFLELLSQHYRLDCVKVKEHDPKSAASFVQVSVGLLNQVDDGTLDSKLRAIDKLQWVQRGAHLRF